MAVDLIVRGPDEGSSPSQSATPWWRDLLLAARTTETPMSMASPFVAAGAAFAIGRGGTDSPGVLAFAAVTAGLCVSAAWHSDGATRRAWAALALGSGLWCAGRGSRPVWDAVRSGAPDG